MARLNGAVRCGTCPPEKPSIFETGQGCRLFWSGSCGYLKAVEILLCENSCVSSGPPVQVLEGKPGFAVWHGTWKRPWDDTPGSSLGAQGVRIDEDGRLTEAIWLTMGE